MALAALWVLASLAAASCQTGTTTASPSPSAASPGGALARADALLYKGDYTRAEAAYRRLAPGDPHAESHLALLLTYESRYEEALAAAEAAASSRPDSLDLGILARARDWSQDYDGALRAGAAAVAAPPVSPLARAFFAEALADAGLYARARAQLVMAQNAAADGYTRAEVDRDWANLYRDEGDAEQELNHFELSLREQPSFPERSLELVRYFYGTGRPDRAHALIAGLEKAPHAYWALELAAEAAAYLGGDAGEAASLYAAALAARPGAPEASLGEAELDANAHRFQAAHDLLLPVLRSHPGAVDVYLFLRYLDQLVLNVDVQRDLAGLSAAGESHLVSARDQALARLNSYRSAAGLPAMTSSPSLAEAAQSHAYYVLFNRGASQLSGLGIHSEDRTLPGFTGANGLDRAQRAGFTGRRLSEVIDHVEMPANSVETWADSVYHRYPLLDPAGTGAGFGTARAGSFSVEVMEIGLGAPAAGPLVAYPVPGQTGVPPDFAGSELPDPAPGAQYPIGYPITVAAGGASRLNVTGASLTDSTGRTLPVFSDRPGAANPDLGQNQWAMLPTRPLAPGATYTADVQGTVDGAYFHHRWSFTVVPV